MKITDRVKRISGVESAYWNSNQNQLTIYYSGSVPKENIKAQVVAEVRDVGLVNAVDKFVFISLDAKNKEDLDEFTKVKGG